jgi:teichoic acid transport system ATP-binding protein
MADISKEPVLIVSDIHVDYIVSVQRNSTSIWKRVLTSITSSKTTLNAVKGVSFVVHRGEVVGIVGGNGSGKSSLIRVIAGLQRPAKGAVWASTTPAMLSINGTMIRALSGSRNIRLSLFALGFTKAEVADRYNQVVKMTGLKDSIHRPIKTYSSGMQARLKFAIAMSRTPEILLIDEALGTGDGQFANKSSQLLRDMKENAGAVLMVNHSRAAIVNSCDRVLWIEKGELKADGPTAEVMELYEKVHPKRKSAES